LKAEDESSARFEGASVCRAQLLTVAVTEDGNNVVCGFFYGTRTLPSDGQERKKERDCLATKNFMNGRGQAAISLPFVQNGTKTFFSHSCASAEQFRVLAKFSRAKKTACRVAEKQGSQGEELCKR